MLRHRDIGEMSAAEKARLAAMFAGCSAAPPVRRTRPPAGLAPRRRRRRPHPARSAAADGRARRDRLAPARHRPRRVVLLVDVSGSMSPYADALLRLAHRFVVTGTPGAAVEMFTIGTRLTHVTRAMRLRDPDRAIVAAGGTVPDWSGGTRLGETLQIFLDRWGQRGLARGAVVVVFSDGWERGDTELLGEQMRRLHGLAHRVVWVNPHRGKAGYEPVQQGIVAALTHVDDFVAGHSLATFAELIEVVPMREVLTELMRWWEAGETVGVGTVVATFQSAPRPAGASMLVGPDGEAVGSVSGGCVEGAVYELGQAVVDRRQPVLQRYGVSDDDAFAVGLTCGGILDVFVEKVNRETFPELGEIAADIEAGRPVAVATVIEHPDPSAAGPPRRRAPRRRRRRHPVEGSLGSERADDAGRRRRRGLLAAGHHQTLTYGPDGERRGEGMRVFVRGRSRRRRGCWCSAPSTSPRRWPGSAASSATTSPCATPGPSSRPTSRFPEADEVVVDWPHRYLRAEAEAPAGSTGAPCSACSPTTRSSTCRCSRWRCGCPRSATSARWGRGAPTTTG